MTETNDGTTHQERASSTGNGSRNVARVPAGSGDRARFARVPSSLLGIDADVVAVKLVGRLLGVSVNHADVATGARTSPLRRAPYLVR
jgi:hypothetical protein